mmetsp:Transcript_20955/g.31043  ORF Transcript_20955/g.31043 Transcript_20955/m.31043 type:complete len:341 (+) Transcript_20955:51-1073(+)|eukprot:CAMPEP_0194221706 /NCGR_PEP_ID=MMETSP0156-20130528/31180_1 /TAXON_ID=33649 /ORGANISM="Thalassionema nitzschioides, Strain L26-B" /LENGTH=340 /DNA_ID=CAMNT_0038952201 /DNA_START=41 /DNA_END=1063 /DNA_ORIENTATION=-
MDILWIAQWSKIILLANSGFALNLIDSVSSPHRRNLILSAPTILASPEVSFKTKSAEEPHQYSWNEDATPVDWSQFRYSTSTLTGSSSTTPARSNTSALYPQWMNGYWLTKYKFTKASFPQGRNVLSLRVPGAGLATCLSLPNVGYSPPAFCQNYLSTESSSGNSNYVYEDVAYNIPRKLEAFWTQCKVTAVQTTPTDKLSAKCFVTGEQCTKEENPQLHAPATRFVLDFEGPTRSGGRVSQSIDTTLLHTNVLEEGDSLFCISNQYAQFNIQQELQCFYKELINLQRNRDDFVEGSLRVAAYLPKTESRTMPYDESEALALYDYSIQLNRIDESDASQV